VLRKAQRWAWGFKRLPNDCGATIMAGIGFSMNIAFLSAAVSMPVKGLD
jgi:hypothetical protein